MKDETKYYKLSPEQFDEISKDWWEKSREKESESLTDLEKHLWLANSSAATIAIGLIKSSSLLISNYKKCGAWAFILGIVLLILSKFLTAFISSRDRSRFQKAMKDVDSEDDFTSKTFKDIRDCKARILNRTYHFLIIGSGVCFISGLALTIT